MTSSSSPALVRGLDTALVVYSLVQARPAATPCEQFILNQTGWFSTPLVFFEAHAVLTKVYGVPPALASSKLARFTGLSITVLDLDLVLLLASLVLVDAHGLDLTDAVLLQLARQLGAGWLATEDLKIGDKFRQRIDDAIRLHDKLLVVLSQNSVNSAWVEEEVEAAFAREHKEDKLVLFPVRLDDAVMKTEEAWAATLQRMRHIGDFTKWRDHDSYKKAFERLLRDLQGEKEKEAAARR